MTTIHSYTGDQPTLDTMHKDLYRAPRGSALHDPDFDRCRQGCWPRSAAPEGQARRHVDRVPTPNVSVVDFKFVAKKNTTAQEINEAIIAASNGALKGILGYTDEPLVSRDFNHDSHSSIFALDQTKVLEGNFVRILTWYDNEWGFSNRMSDTAVALAKLI